MTQDARDPLCQSKTNARHCEPRGVSCRQNRGVHVMQMQEGHRGAIDGERRGRQREPRLVGFEPRRKPDVENGLDEIAAALAVVNSASWSTSL